MWPSLASSRGPKSVVGTPHDLSRRDPSDSRVCVYCHVPHNAGGEGPLWAREIGPRSYEIYSSRTLDATPGQPDGASKLCLSCHDGTLAPDQPGRGGARRPTIRPFSPHDEAFIGSDLSNDHPISFVYGAELAVRDRQLALPEQRPSGLGKSITEDLLDRDRKLQCTSCHSAHDNSLGGFLRVSNDGARLCQVCHERRDYRRSAHQVSQSSRFRDNCMACHVDHRGARDTPLLAKPQQELCGSCHQREAAAMGPAAVSRHGLEDGLLAPEVSFRTMRCATCHDPHTVRPKGASSRRFLTDPDDRSIPRPMVREEITPHGYVTDPHLAAQDTGEFCMDCHDGTWPGALNLRAELSSVRFVRSEFAIGRANLHASHARTVANPKGTGCTYCHDVHGTRGNTGVPRGKLLYPWLSVNEFPYRQKGSCSTGDILGRCHSRR